MMAALAKIFFAMMALGFSFFAVCFFIIAINGPWWMAIYTPMCFGLGWISAEILAEL